MQKLFYLIANAMAAFMDFAVGCLIAVLAALGLHHQLLWWEPLVAGAVFGLLPDYDVVFQIIWTGINGRKLVHKHHESLMHWPLFILLIVVPPVTGVFGQYWGVTAFCCLLAHYIHDAVIMKGDGLGWFFRREPSYWSKQGAAEPASYAHEDWIADHWLRPSKLSIAEVNIGLLAIGVAFGLLTGSVGYGFLLYGLFALGAVLFWTLCSMLRYA